jgi:hypothetical protein
MASEHLRYDKIVEAALRGVVRRTLLAVMEHGLPAPHHLYITFRTDQPGVTIPDYLRQRHPLDMTIVLQYKFWGLEVAEDRFAVTLSFNKINERLTVPFAAVVGFTDPSANFGLQFQVEPGQPAVALAPPAGRPAPPEDRSPPAAQAGNSAGGHAETPAAAPKVVALDSFRKK